MCVCVLYVCKMFVLECVPVPVHRLQKHNMFPVLPLSTLCPWDSLSLDLEWGWSSAATKLQWASIWPSDGISGTAAISGVFTWVPGFKLRLSCLYSKRPYPLNHHRSRPLFCFEARMLQLLQCWNGRWASTCKLYFYSHCPVFSPSIRVSSIGTLPQPWKKIEV